MSKKDGSQIDRSIARTVREFEYTDGSRFEFISDADASNCWRIAMQQAGRMEMARHLGAGYGVASIKRRGPGSTEWEGRFQFTSLGTEIKQNCLLIGIGGLLSEIYTVNKNFVCDTVAIGKLLNHVDECSQDIFAHYGLTHPISLDQSQYKAIRDVSRLVRGPLFQDIQRLAILLICHAFARSQHEAVASQSAPCRPADGQEASPDEPGSRDHVPTGHIA